jgi:hypothetical protein
LIIASSEKYIRFGFHGSNIKNCGTCILALVPIPGVLPKVSKAPITVVIIVVAKLYFLIPCPST